MKKKLIMLTLALALIGLAGVAGQAGVSGSTGVASAAMSYECWTHPNGKPDKMVHVTADSNGEAVSKAIEKFKSIGVKPIGVTCK